MPHEIELHVIGLVEYYVEYQFLPIIVCCELYNQALLLSRLHTQSDLGWQQTFLHHIGQEHLVGSSSTFAMLVTAC